MRGNADDQVLCTVCFEYRENGVPCANGCVESKGTYEMKITYNKLEPRADGRPRYEVLEDGDAMGVVYSMRVPVGPPPGSRIRSGRERTEWRVEGDPYRVGHSTRDRAARDLIRHH